MVYPGRNKKRFLICSKSFHVSTTHALLHPAHNRIHGPLRHWKKIVSYKGLVIRSEVGSSRWLESTVVTSNSDILIMINDGRRKKRKPSTYPNKQLVAMISDKTTCKFWCLDSRFWRADLLFEWNFSQPCSEPPNKQKVSSRQHLFPFSSFIIRETYVVGLLALKVVNYLRLTLPNTFMQGGVRHGAFFSFI